MRLILVPAFLLLMVSYASAQSPCSLPVQITPGNLASATQNMRDFKALATCSEAISPSGPQNSVQFKGSEALQGVPPLSNGQVIVGTTGSAPSATSIVGGDGIVVTNHSGAITLDLTAGAGGLYNQVLSLVPTSTNTGLNTWFNQSGSVLTESSSGISLDSPSSGGSINLSGRFVAAPAPPYKVKGLIAATRDSGSNDAVGLGWYDGTGKLQTISYMLNSGNPSRIVVSSWASSSSLDHNDFVSGTNTFSEPIWFQLSDDGTTVTFGFSQDGANFLPVFSSPKSSSFLGAAGYSNLIFFLSPQGSRNVATLLSWSQE